MMRSLGNRERGFTLTELMVAVFILGVALVAILYGMNATLAGIRLGEDTAEATNLLRRAAEETKLEPFDNIQNHVWANYQASGFDVERTIRVLETNPQLPAQRELIQVLLRAWRLPRADHPVPRATWTFLLYRGGI
ncbi:MAG TPA: type II secretion system protein [Bacillota bacterium]|nr:type II secretion system protein [Bacillota bacterium]